MRYSAKNLVSLLPIGALTVALVAPLRCTPTTTQSQQSSLLATGNEVNLAPDAGQAPPQQPTGEPDAGSGVDAVVAMGSGEQDVTQSSADGGLVQNEELAAYEAARPVFQRYCATCHSGSGQLWRVSNTSHFDMSRYPFGGHHASTITATIRRVLGATGQRATMPPSRSSTPVVQGAELQLVLAWADAVDRATAARGPATHAGGHEHHHH